MGKTNTMKDEIEEKLWDYLCDKLSVLDDNNYTARLIYKKVSKYTEKLKVELIYTQLAHEALRKEYEKMKDKDDVIRIRLEFNILEVSKIMQYEYEKSFKEFNASKHGFLDDYLLTNTRLIYLMGVKQGFADCVETLTDNLYFPKEEAWECQLRNQIHKNN